MPKAINTPSEHAVVIDFPLQQWLHERTSASRFTYRACLVLPEFHNSSNIFTKGNEVASFEHFAVDLLHHDFIG
jgi:hypothetical protein